MNILSAILIFLQLEYLKPSTADKILCWIPTDPEYYDKSLHVKNTWGKRCNHLLFFSSQRDETLPTIGLKTPLGWDYLWGKVRKALDFLYRNYLHKAEWFLKADDDTYVIVENLRYFLRNYNSSDMWYFGKQFKEDNKRYMHGGAGYVLSRGALKQLVEVAFLSHTKCSRNSRKNEDVQLGICLEYAKVKFGNTTDECCKERFFASTIDRHTQPFSDGEDKWFNMFYPTLPGIISCSEKPISFHKINPGLMYTLEYFLYHLNDAG